MISTLILLLYFVLGYATRCVMSDAAREQSSLWLNRYVIYIALPALVLVYVPRIEVDGPILIPVLSAWGVFIASALLVIVVSKVMGWSRTIMGALLFTVPFGNTSFLGVPFTKALYGDAGLPYTLIYDQLGSFLILSTAGIALLSYFTAARMTLRHTLLRILLFPSFVALIVALFLDINTYSTWLLETLKIVAATLSPVAMIAIGQQLELRFEAHERTPFLFGLSLKLFLAPLALLGVFYMLGITTLAAQVSVFEAAMAPMVSSSAMAMLAGLEKRFVASVLGYGIVLSFLTVPLMHQLITLVLS